MQAAFSVHRGGNSLGSLGQTSTVTGGDVINELSTRGYSQQEHAPAHHVVLPETQQLTKSMAINVAIDEAIIQVQLPRTGSHYYRCPTGSCPMPSAVWNAIVGWCANTANGYLNDEFVLPSWAQNMLHSGTLSGFGNPMGHMSGFQEWLSENGWFVETIGDAIKNYGSALTAKQIQDAIKANTDQQLSKADAAALVAELLNQGKIPAGQAGVVAKGASMAAQPAWMMPAMIGAGILIVVMMMKK